MGVEASGQISLNPMRGHRPVLVSKQKNWRINRVVIINRKTWYPANFLNSDN